MFEPLTPAATDYGLTNQSAGLWGGPGARFRTCVEIMVVLRSLCPRSSWTVRMS
jgi:hypothetical protein